LFRAAKYFKAARLNHGVHGPLLRGLRGGAIPVLSSGADPVQDCSFCVKTSRRICSIVVRSRSTYRSRLPSVWMCVIAERPRDVMRNTVSPPTSTELLLPPPAYFCHVRLHPGRRRDC